MAGETGPYLRAAAFCDAIVEGKDGVLSLIRVVDRLTVSVAGQGLPGTMPPVVHRLKLVMMLVSGEARGTQPIEVVIETPDGIRHPGWAGTVLLEGEDRGANVIVELDYEFTLEGVHWFHVLLDGRQLTQVPFRVIYQRVGPATRLP